MSAIPSSFAQSPHSPISPTHSDVETVLDIAELICDNSIVDRRGIAARSVRQRSGSCPKRIRAGHHGGAARAECSLALDARFWRTREALPGMERRLRHLFAVRIGWGSLLEHRHFVSAEGHPVHKAVRTGDREIGCGIDARQRAARATIRSGAPQRVLPAHSSDRIAQVAIEPRAPCPLS